MSLPIEGQDFGRIERAPAQADSDLAHILRLMRLLLTAIDHAGDDGLVLTRDSALATVIRRLVLERAGAPYSSRTAVMALRDLVFRVEAARAVLTERLGPDVAGDLGVLLDTADIRVFLAQEV